MGILKGISCSGYVVASYFFRSNQLGQLWDTMTSDNATNHELSLISQAGFVAFDPEFLDIIGHEAVVEKMFNVSAGVHEAPVWLPETNQIIFTPIGENFLYNIDLNSDPVTHYL